MTKECSAKWNGPKMKDLWEYDVGNDGEHSPDNKEPWEVLPHRAFHVFYMSHTKASQEAIPASWFSIVALALHERT